MLFFCFYCKAACKTRITVISSRADSAFTTCGFSNWKYVMCKFREHEHSQAHRDVLNAYAASKSLPISALLQREPSKVQSQYRRS